MAAEFDKLLPLLVNGKVEFILVGGIAANLHGGSIATYDVDVVYSRSAANIERIAEVLKTVSPYLRGAPPGLPFVFDRQTIRNGLNFTLTTAYGDLDLLGEVVGGGGYADLLPRSFEVTSFGVKFLCVDLPTLIALKRAAGRPKDFQSVAELEAILEESGE